MREFEAWLQATFAISSGFSFALPGGCRSGMHVHFSQSRRHPEHSGGSREYTKNDLTTAAADYDSISARGSPCNLGPCKSACFKVVNTDGSRPYLYLPEIRLRSEHACSANGVLYQRSSFYPNCQLPTTCAKGAQIRVSSFLPSTPCSV